MTPSKQVRRRLLPREPYPYSELDVFRAGYDRGREFLRLGCRQTELEGRLVEELASRRLTLHDLTAEGLLMLGMQASFVPRTIFDEGVRRALEEATETT